MFTTIVIYLISIVTFLLFGIDKHRAMRRGRRIPEAVLLLFAALGGAFGALIGMLFFWHKVRKPLFLILVPLLLIGQWVGGWFLIHLAGV